jgi:subtilisin-like proprotein convertase family protein
VTASKLRFGLLVAIIAITALLGSASAALADLPCGTYANANAVDIPPPLASMSPVARDVNGASSSIDVSGTLQTIDAVSVTLPELDYPDLSKLRLTLIGPDETTEVVLADQGTLAGTKLLGTTLIDSAAGPLSSASAPYSGPFTPDHALDAFHNQVQNGIWTLEIETSDASKKGTLLHGWQLHLDSADCAPVTRANANLAPAVVSPGGTVTVDAAASTSVNNGPLTYEYDFGSGYVAGPSVQTYTAPGAVGHVPIKVRVTDTLGGSDVATLDLAVTNPPIASVTPATPSIGRNQGIPLSAASSSDPDGGAVTYEWADNGVTFVPGTVTHNVSFAHSGTYSVGLRVTDVDGATDQTAATVTVTNGTPVAAFTFDATPVSGQPVGFDAHTSTDPEQLIANYQWDFGDGTAPVTTTSPTVAHTFASPQTAHVTVKVTDDEGAFNSAAHDVTLVAPPHAVIVPSPSTSTAGTTVSFDGAGSTGSGGTSAIVRYDWDLDGAGGFEQTSSTPQASRAYPNPGRVTVRLKITDASGHTATSNTTITIVTGGGGGGGTGGGATGGGSAGGGSAGGGSAGGGGAAGGGSAGGGSAGAGSAGGGLEAALAGSAIQKLKSVLKSGVVVTCTASQTARCVVTLELAVRDARKLKLAGKKSKKPVVLARATGSTKGAKPGRLVLRISKRNAAKLRKVRRVTLHVVGQASFQAGSKVKLSRAVLVRAP